MKPTRKTRELMKEPVPPAPGTGRGMTEKQVYTYKCCGRVKKYTNERDVMVYTAEERKDVGGEMLIVTVYRPNGAFYARIFQQKSTWIVQKPEDERPHECVFGNYETFVSYPTDERQDENIFGALKKWSYDREQKINGLEALRKYQLKLRRDALEARYDKIRKSTANDMLEIRPLSKKVKDWVDQVAMKKSRYIFYTPKHGAKMQHGTCSHCLHEVLVPHPRHRTSGVCPHCHSAVTFIADGIFARSNGFNDTDYFAWFQTTRAGFCVRIFEVRYEYTTENGYCHRERLYRETFRIFYVKRGQKKDRSEGLFERKKAYKWDNFKNTGTYEWCENWEGWNWPSMIYPGNLREIFERNRCYQYCQIHTIAKRCGKISPERMFTEPKRYPWIEYLVKLGLYRLTREVILEQDYDWRNAINRDGKNLKEILKVGKKDIPILRKINPGSNLLKLYQKLIEERGSIDAETLQAILWCRDLLDPYGYGAFASILQWVSPLKATHYIERQFERVKKQRKNFDYWMDDESRRAQIARDYYDYLKECHVLEYGMTDKQILFPRSLRAAHERTSAAVEAKVNKEADKMTARRAIELNERFGFQADGLLIRAPREVNEIILEGKRQHHCVGGYAKDHATGETTILFLRKQDNPEWPYYTMEVSNTGKIVQIRGFRNCDPTPDVQKFMKKWEVWKATRKSSKNRVKVPA